MATLEEILRNPQLNGVYRVGSGIPDLAGLIRLDAALLPERHALLGALGRALRFPDYYGANWDALEECLFDLSWWPGEVCVLIEHAETLPAETRETLVDIWREAAWEWLKAGRVCSLMLGDGDATMPVRLDA